MLTGKVVRFDDVRGYGFIAPDGGGEDVFVHANVLGDDKYLFGPGLRVEFEATDGDRGPKAYAVHLLPDRGPAAAVTPVASPVTPPVIPPGALVRAEPPAPAPPTVTGPPVLPAAAERAPAASAAPPDSAPPDSAPPDSAPPDSAPPDSAPPDSAPPDQAQDSAAPDRADEDSDDEELCDVLTASAFSQEITELLLKSAPTVTAGQILGMRAELIGFGRQHGWIEG